MAQVNAILAVISLAAIQLSCGTGVKSGSMAGKENPQVRAVDHMVPHVSTVPANKGEKVQLFVREKFAGDAKNKPVVLMVHGGFSPSTLAFDVEREDYSWMSYLASAGFDVFAMDMTGYGRSSRPKMDNPCNVGQAQQKTLIPKTLPIACKPTYPYELVNSQSESDDIDRVVEYIRKLRGTSKVNLLGWSGGGIRSGTYTHRYPEKVEKLVILASSNYSRKNPSGPPADLPKAGAPITIQSREVGEKLRWLPNAKCDGQVAPGMPDHIWELSELQDPVGMTWGPGVLRAPTRTYWGWNADTAKKLKLPTLILVGEYDDLTASNKELYEDLGSENKVFVAISCASHFVVWEKQHGALHQASREWLAKGTFNGATSGMFRIDPQGRFVTN
jgi:pimeloyl-ACP methyl ester carboxylesterase